MRGKKKDSERSGDTDFGIWGIRGLKWLGKNSPIDFWPGLKIFKGIFMTFSSKFLMSHVTHAS